MAKQNQDTAKYKKALHITKESYLSDSKEVMERKKFFLKSVGYDRNDARKNDEENRVNREKSPKNEKNGNH